MSQTKHDLLRLATLLYNRPLLIRPEDAEIVQTVLAPRLASEALLIDEEISTHPVASRFVGDDQFDGRNWRGYRRTSSGVGIISVLGKFVNRGAYLGASSGLISYEGFKQQLRAAAADPEVRTILLDFESPGGQATGAFETAELVRQVARDKPITAVVDGMAASAAYAIASAANRIVTTPSGESGSIGVVVLHLDRSGEFAKRGVKPTLIHAGARKVDGNPFGPLPDDVRADLQGEVDRFYAEFVAVVAAGRHGLTPEAIRATEARTFIGAEAVAVGLADAVGTFDEVIEEFSYSGDRRSPQIRGFRMENQTISAEAHAAAVSAARGEGRQAERTRLRSILSLESAQGRETMARTLALDTDVTAEQADAVLKASPAQAATEPSFAATMRAQEVPDLGTGMETSAPGAKVASLSDRMASRLKS